MATMFQWWDWTHNILSKKHSPKFMNGQSMAISSVFSLFYWLMWAVLLSKVLKEYNAGLHENAFLRMGAQGTVSADKDSYGEYYVQKGKKDVVFHHKKLAPAVVRLV